MRFFFGVPGIFHEVAAYFSYKKIDTGCNLKLEKNEIPFAKANVTFLNLICHPVH